MSQKNTVLPDKGLAKKYRFGFLEVIVKREKNFLLWVTVFFILAGVVYPYPQIAMWVGFAFAGYSAIANDSIQTIGTFISSNHKRSWWQLWLFMGGIFLITVFASWYLFDGDVSYQRLSAKGLSESPKSFSFLQLAAPIVLLVVTRLRMPVSTTFMLLSSFSATSATIGAMLQKSIAGYIIAFFVAIIFFFLVNKYFRKFNAKKAHPAWYVAQWIISGALWAVWLVQDAANIAVYLPRSLSLIEFGAFSLYIFLGLGLLFYLKGDKIQKVIDEKSEVQDVRNATFIDLVYSVILLYFANVSVIPMSTTWVFLGLLAGRELSYRLTSKGKPQKLGKTFRLIGIDILYAGIGLIISIMLAIAINPVILQEVKDMLKSM
jgi:phosphate/sulfate permease